MMETIKIKRALRMEKGLTRAWAIYVRNEDWDGEYMFHSAHWSKARAREMCFPDWDFKLVKINFEIA